MSSRALRKLHGKDDLQANLPDGLDIEADENGADSIAPLPSKSNRKKKNKTKNLPVNPFDLLNDEDDPDAGEIISDEGEPEVPESIAPDLGDDIPVASTQGAKSKKKKKKKKNKDRNTESEDKKDIEGDDDFEASIREVNEMFGDLNSDAEACSMGDLKYDTRVVLSIEHKNLNPDNEMRRIFGSRVVQNNRGPARQRNQRYHKTTKLARPKDNWPHFSKTGLTMSLVETRPNSQLFTFEHNRQYQQVQFEFWDAVESLQPQHIMNVLHRHPYHIDTLLQVSEICKMSEDLQMATEIIERALYVFECSFHPSFSLTSGTCRLDYRRPENRAFFLGLFRHLMFVGERGCYRTSLELCKLILGLDPDGDPLCMLLMLDFYALRASEYKFLIRLFNEWEAHRNLSQLPNFAYSVPLAMFHSALEENLDTAAADEMLQKSLMMFPGFLIPVLDKCSIAPDTEVAAHPFFGTRSQLEQPKALEQLIALYIGRCHSCWKVPEVVTWVEKNVKEVLRKVDRRDPLVEDSRQKRCSRYSGTPRNIYRHILISEIKEASACLPPEMASTPILSYDPLPPTNSIPSYTKPERRTAASQDGNAVSMFFRSLLPNFNPQEPLDEAAGAAGGGDLRQGVVALMDSLRDLLNNIQPVEAPVENQHNGDQPEEFEPEGWD